MKNKRQWFWFKLVAVPIFMFGFSYMLVPLYDVFCDITGLGGRTGRVDTTERVVEVNDSRQLDVSFFSDTSPGFPVEFYPEVKKMTVVPGKFYQLTYIARNPTKERIVGQAVPSVAPPLASLHFNKVECFCFTNQAFEPGETIKMPINFVVEPDIDKDIVDISLSYRFFRIKDKS